MPVSHQEYVDAIKNTAVSTGKKVLIEYLTKQFPYLFIPVLGPVVSFVIGKLVEILVRETEFAIFFKYIDLRVDSQGRAFSQAAMNNYDAQKNGTPEEIKKAELELIDKFRKFAILKS
jgi:hypothetical protein